MKIRRNLREQKLTFVLPQKKFNNKANRLYQATKQELKAVQKYLKDLDKETEALRILFRYGYPSSMIKRYKDETGLDLPSYGYVSTVVGLGEIKNNSKELMEFIGNYLIDYADFIEFEKQYDFAYDISAVIVQPMAAKPDPFKDFR